MMAVFNNLVLYDQHAAQNTLDTIVPARQFADYWLSAARNLSADDQRRSSTR
jgi:hypothetical protein